MPSRQSPKPLPDIQKTADTRGIPIDQVGITNLQYPIQVMDREGKPLPTVATITMSVHLPHHFKGTHMNRFLEVRTKHEGEITMRTLPLILHDLKKRLDAENTKIGLAFSLPKTSFETPRWSSRMTHASALSGTKPPIRRALMITVPSHATNSSDLAPL